MVKEVDKDTRTFPRPDREIRTMYLGAPSPRTTLWSFRPLTRAWLPFAEAIDESQLGEDKISPIAFRVVANHYHLGVPFVDPERRESMRNNAAFQEKLSRSMSTVQGAE